MAATDEMLEIAYSVAGEKIEDVVSKGAMKNPECIDDFLVIKNQYLKSLDQ